MKNKKGIIAVAAMVVAAVLLLGLWYFTRPETNKGAKNISVTVVYKDKSSDVFEINTDSEFLRGALEEKELVKGEEGKTGLFVKEVNGVKADDKAQEWWCFTKDGESVMTGVDQTPIADGDKFEITLTVGF